jgi:Mg2+-importing ATPase
LLGLTLLLVVLTPLVPYLPFTSVFGFVPVPWTLTATVLGITALYVVAAEITKRWFYRTTDSRALKLSPAH